MQKLGSFKHRATSKRKSMNHFQADLIAISMYRDNYGLGEKEDIRNILNFFKEVNSAAGTELGSASELASMALSFDNYVQNPKYKVCVDSRLVEECVADENIQSLEELNAVFENDAFVSHSYKIARYLDVYKQSTGELPGDMNGFMRRYVYTTFAHKEQNLEEEADAQVWLC
mgnify:CR=1 FL=1